MSDAPRERNIVDEPPARLGAPGEQAFNETLDRPIPGGGA